jgi:hypothetical protein
MTTRLNAIGYFLPAASLEALLGQAADGSYVAHPAASFTPDFPEILNLFDLPESYDHRVTPHIGHPENWLNRLYPIDVPPAYIHLLHNPLLVGGIIDTRRTSPFGHSHGPGQLLVTAGNELVSAAYGVLDGCASLPHDHVTGTRDAMDLVFDGEAEYLPGTYYFIGSAHIHFGHFLLEGLSRLWALDLLPVAVRDRLRFIVYEPTLKAFAEILLDRFGIDPDRIVTLQAPTRVERLIAPDIGYRTHHWVRPDMTGVWDRVAGAMHVPSPHRKLFLARKPGFRRTVVNAEAIEALFAENGYRVIFPETMSIHTQIEMVKAADSLAGFVGSQMYLAAFQKPGGRNFIMAPRNFYLPDDALIGTLKGHRTRVLLGEIIDRRPNDIWSCDLETVRAALVSYA